MKVIFHTQDIIEANFILRNSCALLASSSFLWESKPQLCPQGSAGKEKNIPEQLSINYSPVRALGGQRKMRARQILRQ